MPMELELYMIVDAVDNKVVNVYKSMCETEYYLDHLRRTPKYRTYTDDQLFIYTHTLKINFSKREDNKCT